MNQFNPTQIDWTEVGKDYNTAETQRQHILNEINKLEWHSIEQGKPKSAPFMQAQALSRIMYSINGRHTAVAWNGVILSRYSLYGVETHYKDGIGRSYWLDTGDGVVCLCAQFQES